MGDADQPEFRDLDAPLAGPSLSPAIIFEPPVTVTDEDIKTRRNISYVLLALLGAMLVASFAALFIINIQAKVTPPQITAAESDFKNLTTLLNIVFGPMIALVSSVVGFYFGARTAREGVGPTLTGK